MSGTSTRSAVSVAPSLAQTVVSLFADDYGSDEEAEECAPRRGRAELLSPSLSRVGAPLPVRMADDSDVEGVSPARRPVRSRIRKYFRPLARRAYYAALFHLLAINFPYAVLAWVYLFVFTLVRPVHRLPLGAAQF